MTYAEPLIPWLPMRLYKGMFSTPTLPILIDSGADVAFFRAEIAAFLRIDYSQGKLEKAVGLGEQQYWLHQDLRLVLKDPSGTRAALRVDVGFMPTLPIQGLVGRKFFFETFDVLFSENDKTVTLSLREESPHIVDASKAPIFKPPIPEGRRSRKPPTRKR